MSDPFDHPIEVPENNPAAQKVYKLVNIFSQAMEAWLGLVDTIAHGYGVAYHKQQDLLAGIKFKVDAEINRQNFVEAIVAAGISGGVLGAVVGGMFNNADGIIRQDQKSAEGIRDLFSAMADDAASQAGGSAFDYLKAINTKNAFKSPGEDPTDYWSGMRANVAAIFSILHESIGKIIKDILAGKLPASAGDRWYKYFSNIWFIKNFPALGRLNRDFEKEASLCLWIAWGAERDFWYWDTAWDIAQHVAYYSEGAVNRTDPQGRGHEFNVWAVNHDIDRWDPILKEIARIEPTLAGFAASFSPGCSTGEVYYWPRTGYGFHTDVRQLVLLGLFSKNESAQAMSKYFERYGRHIGPDAARLALADAFSGGHYLIRSI